mgnify:CR=1 FL=1
MALSQDQNKQIIEIIKSCIRNKFQNYKPETNNMPFQPYERWTIKGMIDFDHELKVGAEFWDFLGGIGCYEDLLNCFEIAGIELRPEIDKYFKQFRNN